MAQVTVTINERKYQITCEDGQEAHLTRLGGYVDKRLGELVAAVGQVGDAQLLVMVSLLVTDELSDLYSEMDVLKADEGVAARLDTEEGMSNSIEQLAERIEKMAERIEGA